MSRCAVTADHASLHIHDTAQTRNYRSAVQNHSAVDHSAVDVKCTTLTDMRGLWLTRLTNRRVAGSGMVHWRLHSQRGSAMLCRTGERRRSSLAHLPACAAACCCRRGARGPRYSWFTPTCAGWRGRRRSDGGSRRHPRCSWAGVGSFTGGGANRSPWPAWRGSARRLCTRRGGCGRRRRTSTTLAAVCRQISVQFSTQMTLLQCA